PPPAAARSVGTGAAGTRAGGTGAAGTGAAGTQPVGGAPADTAPPGTGGRRLGRAALACIVVSAAGPSKAVVSLPRSGLGPPWWFSLHSTAWLVTVALWLAALAGAGGV